MKSFNALVECLATEQGRAALAGIHRGIERETLRVTPGGELAGDAHPRELGSALTHSRITTDYSESLLEFITPVCSSVDSLLDSLTQTHAFSVQHLHGEQLWPVSMPCFVANEGDIPIARYGSSNTGRMKSLYRTGLTHRYGALMQIIAGVHYNFSVSSALWQQLHRFSGSSEPLGQFISEGYFSLIRNYRRMVWLLPYLFGASPTICQSFIQGRQTNLPFVSLGAGALYLPYATSLRMSDLGYTNQEQEKLSISYNSLDEYLAGIRRAIAMPSQKFARIGVKVDGEYRQLNANILQIENEFYAPIRAKRVTASGEKPSQALARAGVEYIEVRALDVNPFSPVGIDASQVYLLDLFLLYCLLQPSAPTDAAGELEMAANLRAVVLTGREPGLMLARNGQAISLQHWLGEIFTGMAALAPLLDNAPGQQGQPYQQALAQWQVCVDDPQQTLSGRMLQAILQPGMGHGQWVKNLAQEYSQYLRGYPLTPQQQADYEAEASASLARQAAIEAADSQSFDSFLSEYFNDPQS
ncbi:glutamate--cysteine ligase [Shewanella sp. NFH-SH190041]|uniref:glutamate--cysteine ligase n=1 Tax=Shewanella sp. NFH-SH190041 TaxID=2950245 RepID=UPI0021C3D8B3|nr:glutamate--cysteine ligase [Shewanella sp. NFH-SH190041]BDM65384.1 glutamate--cysteine ligase [Shewanella sp. NFH-SH190041]